MGSVYIGAQILVIMLFSDSRELSQCELRNLKLFFNVCLASRFKDIYLIEAEWHIDTSINLTINGSDNDLSPDRRQAIIWTSVGIFLIETLGTNFSDILTKINAFSFKKIHIKMSSGKWLPLCLSLNVLKMMRLPSSWMNVAVEKANYK